MANAVSSMMHHVTPQALVRFSEDCQTANDFDFGNQQGMVSVIFPDTCVGTQSPNHHLQTKEVYASKYYILCTASIVPCLGCGTNLVPSSFEANRPILEALCEASLVSKSLELLQRRAKPEPLRALTQTIPQILRREGGCCPVPPVRLAPD